MISKSPENITYISVSDTFVDGETVETKTETDIKCTVQTSGSNETLTVNGADIVFKYQIIIFDATEISKLPTFSEKDEIKYLGNNYKVLSARKRQHHVEIYV